MKKSILLTLLSLNLAHADEAQVYDEKSGDFYTYQATQLDEIPNYTTVSENLNFSTYGGWKAADRQEATGFFRTEKIDGRWWIIDPEGYLYIHKAINSVQVFDGFEPEDVYELLPKFGLNGTGNWTDSEVMESSVKEETPLAYCPKYSFASSYANTREDDLPIAVFDDEFEDFCKEKAQLFEQYKDDPYVLGYFIDNELSWTFNGGLESHVNVNDPSDKNYQKAMEFLAERNKTADNFDDEDADDYSAVMAERYFSVVTAAIREVDPNHMILGPRLNKSWNRTKEFIEIAGEYLDIIALNHYHRWGTRSNELENIHKWSKKPILLSEFYSMEKIIGADETGAGWKVEDETSKANFYQQFLTTQLEKKYIVGFHWFNFQDDAASSYDPISDPGGLRGIINIYGEEYEQVRDAMKYMNDRIYDFIDFSDSRKESVLKVEAEADTYYQDGQNFATSSSLKVREASKKFKWQVYARFDASEVQDNFTAAEVQFFSISPEEKLTGSHSAYLVEDNDWSESSVTRSNLPDHGDLIAEWSHGDDIQLDVTEQLRNIIENNDSDDKKLSLVIITETRDVELEYASREHSDTYARPKLVVSQIPEDLNFTSKDIGPVAAAGSSKLEDGVYTIRGSGSDIWNIVDEFRYAYTGHTGDFEMVAKVDSMESTNGWAKAGIMARTFINKSTTNVFIFVRPDGKVAMQSRYVHRRLTSNVVNGLHTGNLGTVKYISLKRTGDIFTGYYSEDGVRWTKVASITNTALGLSAKVGLAVTSHNDGVLNEAKFSNVYINDLENE